MDPADTAKIQTNSGDVISRNVHNGSAFHEYPASRPFIHDDYRRDVTKPIIAYPESNRHGVLSALKNLQDRLKQVEREKKQAELHLSQLAASAASSAQSADVRSRLVTQEERCRVLEQQLEKTRVMALEAERDRAEALRKIAALQTDNMYIDNAERRSYVDKISNLEREQLKLMATQTLAQKKIKDLEDRLDDERRLRLGFQNKLQKSETWSETARPLAVERTKPRRRKKRTSSAARTVPVTARGTVGRKYPSNGKHPGHEPPEHFHVNLAEIPFVTGKSTSRSHSLAANFQEVLSLMKKHNSKLCAGPSLHSRVARRGTGFQALRRTTSARSCDRSKPCTEMATESMDELASLILQLEDEFSQLSVDREALTRQMKGAADKQLQNDLTKQLNGVVAHMEAKGEQIVKLKRCQDVLLRKVVTKKTPKSGGRRSVAADSGRVFRVSASAAATPSSSHSKAQGSLHLLKDLKKIQTTLRADDIVWDS